MKTFYYYKFINDFYENFDEVRIYIFSAKRNCYQYALLTPHYLVIFVRPDAYNTAEFELLRFYAINLESFLETENSSGSISFRKTFDKLISVKSVCERHKSGEAVETSEKVLLTVDQKFHTSLVRNEQTVLLFKASAPSPLNILFGALLRSCGLVPLLRHTNRVLDLW